MQQLSPEQLSDISTDFGTYLTPDRDLPCVYFIYGLLTLLLPILDVEGEENHATPDLNVIRTATMQWLCHPTSTQALIRRSQAPCACTALARETILHQKGHAICTNMQMNHRKLCAITLDMLLKLLRLPEHEDMQYRSLPRINKIGRRRVWPTSREDLLPYGPRATVHGLLAWLDMAQDQDLLIDETRVLTVAHVLARYGYPVTLPYLVTSTTLIPRGVIPTLNLAHGVIRDHDLKGQALQPTERAAIGILGRCLGVLVTLTNKACNHVERQQMLHEHRSMLALSYLRVAEGLQLLHDRFPEEVPCRPRDDYTRLLMVLVRDFPDLQTTPDMPTWIAHASTDYAHNLWQQMWEAVLNADRADRCARPGCGRTYADAMVFKRCGGCRRVVYCSRACQKMAWQHPSVPHREICGPLRRVCVLYGSRTAYHPGSEPVTYDRVSARQVVDHFLKFEKCGMCSPSQLVSMD
jgi:hypothetical protein